MNKIPKFEEAYQNTMVFCKNFEDTITKIPGMFDELKKEKKLKLSNVEMTSSNFILGVGHVKCGCPGIVNMIFSNGDWICPSCNGYISEKSAKKIMKKDYDKMAKMFLNLVIASK